MAIDLNSIKKGGEARLPITVVHGSPGMGKTTLAANAPNPIFIRTEDGLGNLQVDTFPEMTSINDVMEALASLYTEDHNYKTVVIDSLSALEPLIHQQVAKDHGKNSIEDIGFGKGYVYALQYWHELMKAIKGLSKQNIFPILIAHTDIVRHDSPDVDSYDRYQIKLHKRAFQMLYEQADIIGYAHYPVMVKKDNNDKGKAVKKADRQLRLVESPSMIAKNRYDMPETINLDFSEFAENLPMLNQIIGE